MLIHPSRHDDRYDSGWFLVERAHRQYFMISTSDVSGRVIAPQTYTGYPSC
jgi:hypothetical protein